MSTYYKIINTYFKLLELINNDILKPFNTNFNRSYIRLYLRKHLSLFEHVICDESNNSPELVDQDLIMATIRYKDGINNKYIDLMFGDLDYKNDKLYKIYSRRKKIDKILGK